MGLAISSEGVGGGLRSEISKILPFPNSPFSGRMSKNILLKKLDKRSSVLYKNLKVLQKRR